jgi:hypothetical protein
VQSKEKKCRKCGVVLVVGGNWYKSFAIGNVYLCGKCKHDRFRELHPRKRTLRVDGKIKCKGCDVLLVPSENWHKYHVKKHYYFCKTCSSVIKKGWREQHKVKLGTSLFDMEAFKKKYKNVKCRQCGVKLVPEINWYQSYGVIGYGSTYLCKKCVCNIRKQYRESNPETISKRKFVARFNFKKQVISHYGGKCTCCGQDDINKLTIDHINGDGAEHRKEINYKNIYEWLVKNNYPDGFTVLCFNCNCAKRKYEICPHDFDKFHSMMENFRNEKTSLGATRRYYFRLKLNVIEKYGGSCVKCGESNIYFLTIDHVLNDAYLDVGFRSGNVLYRKLAKLGFPCDRYQLLCYNCNLEKVFLNAT